MSSLLRSIKPWHWLAISLVIGLALGYLNGLPRENWRTAYGEVLLQREFEEALTHRYQSIPRFTDIILYSERISGVQGNPQTVHVAAGQYFDGKLTSDGGRLVAKWKPRCFVAEIPFRPLKPVPGHLGPDMTLRGYMDALREKGVTYRYAWWRDSRYGLGLWTAGSVLLVGIIWPTVVNLLLFGSAFPPREEKGVSLRGVQTQAAAKSAPAMSGDDLAAIDQMGNKLAESLRQGAATPATAEAQTMTSAPSTAPVLSSKPLEDQATQATPAKVFGADQDDFYPTERHAHPHDHR